jgi:hypothetical protein
MDSANFNDRLQIAGMLGIIASLVFVGLQLKQTDEIASIEGQENAVQRHYDMLSMMAESADVWQRGCIGEELSDAERVLFSKIFTVYVNNNFAGWRRIELTDYRNLGSETSINAFAANVHRYPGFSAAYNSQLAWEILGTGDLGNTFNKYRRLVSTRVEELARIEPDPHYDGEWCGQA